MSTGWILLVGLEVVSARPRGGASRSATKISAAMKTKRQVETAAMTGETCSVTSSQNCLGSVALRPPEANSAIVSSSNEVANANRNDDSMPAPRIGKVTWRSVATARAPRLCAARSRLTS